MKYVVNGAQLYVALLVVTICGFLVWQKAIPPDYFLMIVSAVVGYYFGNMTGIVKKNYYEKKGD